MTNREQIEKAIANLHCDVEFFYGGGKVRLTEKSIKELLDLRYPCPGCGGRGWIGRNLNNCETCKGTGLSDNKMLAKLSEKGDIIS